MKADLKETIRNEYVHIYINALGHRVCPNILTLFLLKSHRKPYTTGKTIFSGLNFNVGSIF